jgi:hypothetical protein
MTRVKLLGAKKSSDVSGVPRRLTAFVGRLHKDTTAEELVELLKEAGLQDVRCKRLEAKDGRQFNTAAFFVSCPTDFKSMFYSEDTWPEGCEVRDWYFKN